MTMDKPIVTQTGGLEARSLHDALDRTYDMLGGAECSHEAHIVLARCFAETERLRAENEAQAERIRVLEEALGKAAPFVGSASTRHEIIAGVDAAALCGEIAPLLGDG